MKNYGLGKVILGVLMSASLFAMWMYWGKNDLMDYSFAVSFIFPMYFLLNAPVFNISTERISIFSLNPFTRNIRAKIDNVNKVIVDISDYKFRIILQMKDGSYKSAVAGRYNDMKPVYNALKETGLQLESDGVGTIDWVG